MFTCTYSREVAFVAGRHQGSLLQYVSPQVRSEIPVEVYCQVCMYSETSLQPMRTKLFEAINSVYDDDEQILATLTLRCD